MTPTLRFPSGMGQTGLLRVGLSRRRSPVRVRSLALRSRVASCLAGRRPQDAAIAATAGVLPGALLLAASLHASTSDSDSDTAHAPFA